jgi:hypothetical protein
MYTIEQLIALNIIEKFFTSDVFIYTSLSIITLIVVASISYSIGFSLSKNKAVGKFACLMSVSFLASSTYLVILLDNQSFGGLRILQTLAQL